MPGRVTRLPGAGGGARLYGLISVNCMKFTSRETRRYKVQAHAAASTGVPTVLTPFSPIICVCQCLTHCISRCDAGGDAIKPELLERRQRAAVERGGEGGTPGVGDLGAAEVEPLELLQPSSRRRRHACRRRRHEVGEALVAERIASEGEMLQRGPPPQGRREGRQRRVANGGATG